jgi:hypothetical protein
MVNSTDRPTTDDYIKGWDTFSVVISILKPSICLFNGVTSFNYIFRSQIFSERLKILDCVKGDKIGNTSPRFCDIVGSDDLSIKCIFIKHSGKYFPYKKWNILLQSKLGDFIDLIYST